MNKETGAAMKNEAGAEMKKVIKVWNYLGMTAEEFANKSGLKPEFQGLCFAGYCCALQHLAYALNLPVEMEDFDPDSVAAKRIRQKFPEASHVA